MHAFTHCSTERIATIITLIILSAACGFAQGQNTTNHGQQENFIGTQLMSLGLYDEAMSHYLDALAYFEKHHMTADKVRTKNHIFNVYYRTRRLKESEDILHEAMAETSPADTMLRVSILNNLGIVYAATHRYDKALDAYKQTLELGRNSAEAKASALINIADLYFRQNDMAQAEHYLSEGLRLTTAGLKPANLAQMYLNMALVGVCQSDSHKARKYADKASLILPRLPRDAKINALAQIADIHLNLADSTTALRYIIQYEAERDSVQANINSAQLQKLLVAYDTNRLKARNENLALALSRRTIIVWATSIIALFAIILILTLIHKHNAMKKANGIISRQQQQLLDLEKEKAERERITQQRIIDEKQRQLLSFSTEQATSNEFRTKLESEITDALRALPANGADTAKAILSDAILQLTHHRERAIADDFRTYFEQVHPDFFNRLYDLHPNLTQNDLRLCAFLFLGMTTKEIASITYKEVRSVETSRLRLRKKLNLEQGADISKYLHSIYSYPTSI